jgi:hypothetical protein
VRITPSWIERVSGPALAIPDARAPIDVAILDRAAALFPALGAPDGFGARFGRELNATDDRRHFRPAGSGLPVIEGKQIEPFRVALASARHAITARDAEQLIERSRFNRPRLAYRDVASATNRLTLIAAILPADVLSTHTVFCLRTPLPFATQHFLCGVFNSFVVNYLVRLRVTTHVTTATVERLPIPRIEDGPRACRQIAALARVLARRRDGDAAVRLQVLVARLYRLSADELRHVLDTFPLVAREERDAVLRAYT